MQHLSATTPVINTISIFHWHLYSTQSNWVTYRPFSSSKIITHQGRGPEFRGPILTLSTHQGRCQEFRRPILTYTTYQGRRPRSSQGWEFPFWPVQLTRKDVRAQRFHFKRLKLTMKDVRTQRFHFKPLQLTRKEVRSSILNPYNSPGKKSVVPF